MLNLLKNAEAVAAIIICCAILGVAAWGQHHKRAAEDARLQLAAAEARTALCNEAVAQLDAEAKEREAAAAQALAEATAKADKYALRADKILRAPAAVPGDDCASARARARAWLEARQ